MTTDSVTIPLQCYLSRLLLFGLFSHHEGVSPIMGFVLTKILIEFSGLFYCLVVKVRVLT